MSTSKLSDDPAFLNDASLEPNIVQNLPPDFRIVRTTRHGMSEWTTPLRIDIESGNGHHGSLFVKIARGDLGKSMVRGEFESMKMLHNLCPELVVKPLAWGTCSSAPDTHFYVSEFHEMSEEAASPEPFCAKIAELHLKSMRLRSQPNADVEKHNGRFGFHVTTHLGMLPRDNRWSDSWEEFYIKGMQRVLAFEEKTHGQSDEMDTLVKALMTKVIPRLLRPLETQGRSISPTLIHGDLQIRNVRTDLTTGQPVMFDAGSFWGHDEYDIGKWNITRFQMGSKYLEDYHKYVEKSAPENDWADRNILYSIQYNLLSSAHYASNTSMRNMATTDMKYLAEKYPNGVEGSNEA